MSLRFSRTCVDECRKEVLEMGSFAVGRTFIGTVKQQRLMLSAAVIVGLTLVLVAHAPLVPVLAGCGVVVVLSFLRCWFSAAAKPSSGDRA